MSRVLLALVLCALAWLAGPAAAASYSYRSDSFAWESASNAVVWDRTCTRFPGDDDKATVNFTGGFQFRFAGVNYAAVRILANGMLQFGADQGFHRAYANTSLPAGPGESASGCVTAAPERVLMGYWTDLNPVQPGSGNVTWQQKGTAPNRYFVVSWNNVYQYNTSTPYAVQIILYEGGEFKYQYGNANATGSRATIGVQVSASDYTLYSYNSGYNANGSAIRWFIPSGAPARVADYRFDEYGYSGKVGEVADSSGNRNHGLRVGAADSSENGQVCRALDVPRNTDAGSDGVDTLLNLPSSVGSRGALSFWVRTNSSWNSGQAALFADASLSSAAPFYVQRLGGGALQFRLSDGAGSLLTASSADQSFAARRWVHVAVTWRLASGSNQSTLRVYVNGALSGTAVGTTNGQLSPAIGALLVGDNRGSIAPAGMTQNSANGLIDELRVYNYDLGPVEVAMDMSDSHACLPPLHHVEISHASGVGLTCTPSTLSLRACANADCSALFNGDFSGSLSGAGAASVVWPDGAAFTIPNGGSTSLRMQLTSVGSAQLALADADPAPSDALRCNFGSPECSFSAAAAGLLLSLPAQRSETATAISVAAVRQADDAPVCVPAFANVNRSIGFSCAYELPASGTLPVRLNGQALNASGSVAAACGASRSLSLNFDANGRASLSMLYADAGRLRLSAQYSGSGADAGLQLDGSASVVVAPADFLVDNLPSGALSAGAPFGLRITARNAAGAITPNFGAEGEAVSLGFVRRQPAPGFDGSFSGSASFSAGVANPVDLRWSEVGRGDLSVALADGDYLGSGLNVVGSSGSGGALGPFRPHHFLVSATPACGGFSYAGQPFALTVTARNGLASPGVTRNYDGGAATSPNFARSLSLGEVAASGLGAFAPASWPASQFVQGQAAGSLSYAYASPPGAPLSVGLRAVDAEGVSSAASAAEPLLSLRQGRLQLLAAVGSASQPLSLPLRIEYWSGRSWVLSTDDACTSLGADAVALSQRVSLIGAAASWTNTLSLVSPVAGVGKLQLGPPSPAGSGTVTVAINLGAAGADRACLAAPRPSGTAAGLSWLRSRHGFENGCGGRWDSDPSARASFGALNPESQKRVHERQLY